MLTQARGARCSLIAFGVPLVLLAWGTASHADDLDTIRERLMKPLLSAPSKVAVRELLKSIQPSGGWPDIDYTSKSRSAWPCPAHLSRVKVLAQAHFATQPNARDPKVLAAAREGLDYWLSQDPQNPNWWWNRIGVPRSLLPILLMLDEELSADQRAGGLKILRRAKIGMTGQNLVWVTDITAGRGLLEGDGELVAKAYRRIADEIRIGTGEGIQADFSFHQHGPCLYSHGYGAGFIVDCARIAALVDGTAMEFPLEKIELLANLILEGTQWMARNSATDFGAEGREIARKGQSASHLVAAARYMLQLETSRDDEFRALAARAAGLPAPPLVGNRHFWRADIMTHHRPSFYASARLHSKRLANTDGPANSEGLLSHHLADGCMVLMQDGSEFRDIFGVWDWQKIPGTTVEQKPQLTGSPRRMGTTDFVGGVSDGDYGLTAGDFERGTLSAKKSWFFFDREIICLGAGIRCDSPQRVSTTINQCFLRGGVAVSDDGKLRTLASGQHEPVRVDFVWHDRVAYIMLAPTPLSIHNDGRSGSWHAANRRYPDRKESCDVFTAWIDHGTQPQDAQYAYIVVPDIGPQEVDDYLEPGDIQVLSNTSQLQAVEHRELKRIAAAFYEPGELRTESGLQIHVSKPCLLLAHVAEGRVTAVTVSNPRNTAAEIRVETHNNTDPQQNRVFDVALPGAFQAGSSVTQR